MPGLRGYLIEVLTQGLFKDILTYRSQSIGEDSKAEFGVMLGLRKALMVKMVLCSD